MAVNLGGRLFEACVQNNLEEAAGLIAQGADVNYANDWMRDTPLHKACEHESPALATLLLDSGANIEARDAYGRTPLHRALQWGREAVIALLLDRSADIKAKSNAGRTCLHIGSSSLNAAVVSLLLDKGLSIEAKDKDGKTPIFNAYEVTLPVLLQRGANIHARDNDQRTPLHSAIADDNNLDVFCALLEGGAKVEARCGEDKLTPLMLACQLYSKSSNVLALLERGASLTATERHGMNALHHAAFSNERENCQLLILFGADPTEEDWKGRSAVSHYGCDLDDNDEHDDDDDPPLTLDQKLERVAELTTPPTLFWACREVFDTLAGLLVDLGASLTDVNEEGLNALHIAAYWDNEDIWWALIARGADPAVVDSQGRSALTAYGCELGEADFNDMWEEDEWDEADVAEWKQDGVNKMLEAREKYVMLVRQQKWTKNWPFLHWLEAGSDRRRPRSQNRLRLRCCWTSLCRCHPSRERPRRRT
jgi:ankyrin repeat protein